MQYVSNANVEHEKAKPTTSDSEGKFNLEVVGAKEKEQTSIAVIPTGKFNGYVVVNEKELNDITLGRITPLSVFICKQEDLERRKAEMININMQKHEERATRIEKRMQTELEALRKKNDYLNIRYKELNDSLQLIANDRSNALDRIQEYAELLVKKNLDEADDSYIKAYHCFEQGEIDSVSFYLNDDLLTHEAERLKKLKIDSDKKRSLAHSLNESARQDDEQIEKGQKNLTHIAAFPFSMC